MHGKCSASLHSASVVLTCSPLWYPLALRGSFPVHGRASSSPFLPPQGPSSSLLSLSFLFCLYLCPASFQGASPVPLQAWGLCCYLEVALLSGSISWWVVCGGAGDHPHLPVLLSARLLHSWIFNWLLKLVPLSSLVLNKCHFLYLYGFFRR